MLKIVSIKRFLQKSIILAIVLFYAGCTVNEQTGVIMINNMTGDTINNISIGETVLSYSIPAGSKYDYYYTGNLSGSLKAEDCTTGFYDGSSIIEYKGTFSLVTGFWITIEITKEDNNFMIMITNAKKDGYDQYQNVNMFMDDFYAE